MGKNLEYNIVLPEGKDTLTADMVKLPEGFEGCLVIPEGVRVIDKACFSWKPITAVVFPKSLREIGMHAFFGCRLKELRVEGDGGKIIIIESAFAFNPELTAVTLGNCELGIYTFIGCPVSRVTLTGESIPTDTLEILGFGGCYSPSISDNFFETVWDKYGSALGTYILKGKLVKTNYEQYVHNTGKQMHYVDIDACAEKCGDIRCYTLAGFEDERGKAPVFEWEKVE